MASAVLKGPLSSGPELVEIVLEGVDLPLQLGERDAFGSNEYPPVLVSDMALGHHFDPCRFYDIAWLTVQRKYAERSHLGPSHGLSTIHSMPWFSRHFLHPRSQSIGQAPLFRLRGEIDTSHCRDSAVGWDLRCLHVAQK